MPLIKRSDCVVFFFRDGKLHCKNYLTGIEVESAAIVVPVLEKMDQWRTPREAEKLLPEYSRVSVRRSLRQLLAHTLLVKKGFAQAKREAALAQWHPWGVEARLFHFATKRAHRLPPKTDEVSLNCALRRERPQPASIKRYSGASRFVLPDPGAWLGSELPRILLARRTHRAFALGRVSLEQLSVLLWLTWGVTGYIRWPGLRVQPLKTSPSGGARHPLEVYLWCLRVSGLPRGLYHYRPDQHRLELLRRGARADRVVKLCGHQDWIRHCCALFVMAAVLPRVMWRYRFSRAYRVVLLEAGHFCQTFCLVATWLGLAPFCTAALDDERMEKDLGLDGVTETVLYAAGVGMKVGASDDLGWSRTRLAKSA
jgi:SagB-type dehydrogenase family enzyme